VFPNVTTTKGSDLKRSIAGISRALTRVIRRNLAILLEGTATWTGACDAATLGSLLAAWRRGGASEGEEPGQMFPMAGVEWPALGLLRWF
jgi:hypothetical protein